jgi:hypothetical protein
MVMMLKTTWRRGETNKEEKKGELVKDSALYDVSFTVAKLEGF